MNYGIEITSYTYAGFQFTGETYFGLDWPLPGMCTQHFMAKALAIPQTWGGNDPPLFSLAYGFWEDTTQGLEKINGNCINGIGFGYSSGPNGAAKFPNPNYYAVVARGNWGTIFVKDTGIPIYDGPWSTLKYKFNVIAGRNSAEFYIDNVLVSTITEAECPAVWPNNKRLYPSATLADLDPSRYVILKFQFPIIAGSDFVCVPPTP
jgi:hypothetical protein